MTMWCAHCKKLRPIDEFRVRRKEGFMLWTGHRVKFARHTCGTETIMLDSASVRGGKMAAAQSR